MFGPGGSVAVERTRAWRKSCRERAGLEAVGVWLAPAAAHQESGTGRRVETSRDGAGALEADFGAGARGSTLGYELMR
jgi:hypothetical protein